MGLVDRLSADMVQAMRDKDKVRLSVIRMVKAAVKYAEIEAHHALSDDEVISVLRREVKQRKDALDAAAGSGRTDFIADTQAELEVLYSYLPASLSDDSILEHVMAVIAEVGAVSKADMGKVMSGVMSRIGTQAEGKTISRIVQTALSNL